MTTQSLKPGLNRIHALLAVQSVVVILVSINRLGPWTLGYVLPNEFLRWVDFNNMLSLPLVSLVAFYLLKKQLEAPLTVGLGTSANGRGLHLALNLTFIVGVYLLGASYGDHEVTNYLHARFCATDSASALCRIVIFNDDEFGHWVFFTGFVLVNTALMLFQVRFPYQGTLGKGDLGLLAINGLFIGAGIFANLAFESIGLDLYVVALLAVVAVGLLWRRGLHSPRTPTLDLEGRAQRRGLHSPRTPTLDLEGRAQRRGLHSPRTPTLDLEGRAQRRGLHSPRTPTLDLEGRAQRRGLQPLLVYYSLAYTLGLIGTAVYKAFRG